MLPTEIRPDRNTPVMNPDAACLKRSAMRLLLSILHTANILLYYHQIVTIFLHMCEEKKPKCFLRLRL
jgi:hypothetical protein